MTNTAELESKIKAAGVKKIHLANAIDVTIQTFGNKMTNKTEFKPSEIQTLCEILNINNLKDKERIFFDSKYGFNP